MPAPSPRVLDRWIVGIAAGSPTDRWQCLYPEIQILTVQGRFGDAFVRFENLADKIPRGIRDRLDVVVVPLDF